MARRHATAEAFELVGMSSDPTPGDPDLIEQIRRRYTEIADSAEEANSILRQDGAISSGRGEAMTRLSELVGEELPAKLATTATSYREAADGYGGYVPQLREAQETFDRAVDQAQAAAPGANAAAPELPAEPTEQERAAARQAEDRIAEAQGELSAAQGLAQQAQELRAQAQRRLEDRLDTAAGNAIPERNIFEKIVDTFEDFPILEILAGIFAGLVGIFFPVLGLILGAALFAVTQLPDLIENGFTVEGLLAGLLALVGGAVIGAALGAAAKALAPAVTRTLDRLRDTLRNSPNRQHGSAEDGLATPEPTRPVGPQSPEREDDPDGPITPPARPAPFPVRDAPQESPRADAEPGATDRSAGREDFPLDRPRGRGGATRLLQGEEGDPRRPDGRDGSTELDDRFPAPLPPRDDAEVVDPFPIERPTGRGGATRLFQADLPGRRGPDGSEGSPGPEDLPTERNPLHEAVDDNRQEAEPIEDGDRIQPRNPDPGPPEPGGVVQRGTQRNLLQDAFDDNGSGTGPVEDGDQFS